MDLKVQVEEVPAKFQEIMNHVMRGKDVVIMDKQKAVARVVAITDDQDSQEDDKWTSDDFDIKLSKDL